MKSLRKVVTAFVIVGFMASGAFAQTAPAAPQAPAKPQPTVPESVIVGPGKYLTKAEKDAAKKKKADCTKQAQDQKLSGSAKRAFIKDCIAK